MKLEIRQRDHGAILVRTMTRDGLTYVAQVPIPDEFASDGKCRGLMIWLNDNAAELLACSVVTEFTDAPLMEIEDVRPELHPLKEVGS